MMLDERLGPADVRRMVAGWRVRRAAVRALDRAIRPRLRPSRRYRNPLRAAGARRACERRPAPAHRRGRRRLRRAGRRRCKPWSRVGGMALRGQLDRSNWQAGRRRSCRALQRPIRRMPRGRPTSHAARPARLASGRAADLPADGPSLAHPRALRHRPHERDDRSRKPTADGTRAAGALSVSRVQLNPTWMQPGGFRRRLTEHQRSAGRCSRWQPPSASDCNCAFARGAGRTIDYLTTREDIEARTLAEFAQLRRDYDPAAARWSGRHRLRRPRTARKRWRS